MGRFNPCRLVVVGRGSPKLKDGTQESIPCHSLYQRSSCSKERLRQLWTQARAQQEGAIDKLG